MRAAPRVSVLDVTYIAHSLRARGGRPRSRKGNVVSNWDGSNLDPESVSRHKHQVRASRAAPALRISTRADHRRARAEQLGRVGFQNNAHAKGPYGIF